MPQRATLSTRTPATAIHRAPTTRTGLERATLSDSALDGETQSCEQSTGPHPPTPRRVERQPNRLDDSLRAPKSDDEIGCHHLCCFRRANRQTIEGDR